ncbi:hypothetical protein SY83_01585 [Paenibacillus swuensis]|uniref:ABC transmembrane type-1 domain-containing protein n=1 Tax=Paenibacillus swuensis TaxID=1178515 RepID=A0A172TDW6_9BACL|nr:carbohydrate ABC transporter permease [Paenibacillus swuensis]ANE45235.1 hypothetical protein SY83_01585 [Paenibacillus swuensis]
MIGQTRGYKVFQWFNYSFMFFILIITLLPYLNVFAVSLNDGRDTSLGGITFFPRVFTLDNYVTLLNDSSLVRAFMLTLAIVVLGTAYAVLIQFFAAYALKKKTLVGRGKILIFLVIPMFFSGGLIPTYILYSQTHLLNNFWVYIIPAGFSFYNFIVIRTYIASTVSESLEESARMDGANDFTIFFRIILPLCKPILATIVLWTAVGKWNDWTTTLYFVNDSSLYTLQYKLTEIIKESERINQLIRDTISRGGDVSALTKLNVVTPESLVAAQVIITTLPIICVYPFLQKYFLHGAMIGSVKE